MTSEIKKIKDILESSFSMDNYVSLIEEIFSSAQVIAPYKENPEYSNFSSHIVGYFHVANYVTPDDNKIIILAVELKKNSYVENARSTQRSYAKKLIENSNSDAAIVAFYTKGDDKWRLSFVRLDYEMKFENGRLKSVESITPAKRYSFLVGKEEPSHTAIERLNIFISDKNSMPTIDDLEEAFSVEKVTQEFFNLYCEKYHELRDHLLNNEDFIAESEKCGFTAEQFAKKLMGQIVFLYFLQKKGWLGVGVWPDTLTEKEYNNVFYTKGAQGRLIKEYLPQVYVKKDNKYVLRAAAIYRIPNEAEEVIANNLPSEKSKNWGDGSKHFLRTLFIYCEKNGGNFHNDYLEPLFYDTLNKNRGPMGYSPFLHCRVPFLSGGLFDPIKGYDWRISDFCIPNEIFSNRIDDDPSTGDGILDIFDRYNFTMSEDEPMEREVAIDPEMLGKVFENLLDVDERKNKGAFYTPREIVHYMCQESLINYLSNSTGIDESDIRDFILYGDFMKDEDTVKEKRLGNGDMYISEDIFKLDTNGQVIVNHLKDIDDALADIRIADPAVGSGAFPVGMLNEIVRARQNLTEYMAVVERTKAVSEKQASFYVRELRSERSAYNLKRYTIKNCIFAVDIEPSAVDITQLRLWLTLVIDDEITPNAMNSLEGHRNPLPLPNLECNILCGNSLVDEFEGVPLLNQSELIGTSHEGDQYNLSQQAFEAVLPKLLEVQDALFSCDDPVKKSELIDEISELKDMAIEPQLYGISSEVRKQFEDSKNLASKPYILWQLDFARVFRDKGGFDVVISNPPYIGEEGNKELFQSIAQTEFGKRYYTGKMDYWYFFTSKGIELLKNNGYLCFIAPNNWMTTAGGKMMRKHIANECKIKKFVTFNNVMIFESASQQTMIFLLEKKKQDDNYLIDYKAVGNVSMSQDNLRVFLNGTNIGIYYKANYDPQINNDGRTIQFLDISITNVTDKIKKSDCFYLEDNEIINGIHPHHAEVTKRMLKIMPTANVGDGIFILTNQELNDLHLSEHEMTLMHPYYDTSSIGRYYFNPEVKKQIIYTTSDFKDASLMDDYPTLKKHLDEYVSVITSDNRPYGLHRARKQEFFEEPAIVSLRKCVVPQFSYLEIPAYVTAEWYLIKTERISLKALTCILNSTLIKFWLLEMGKMQGNIYQVDKEPLVNIPIIKTNHKLEEILNSYCDQIYDRRSKGKDVDISDIEFKIDNLIFEAYGLNSEETNIIKQTISEWEGKNRK